MECARCREAVSARLDGEDTGSPLIQVEGHLRRCASCRAWAQHASELPRLHIVQPVPDLTHSILGAIADERRPAASAPRSPARARWATALHWDPDEAPGVVRLALFLLAAAQILVAVPALFGNDLGATIHVAHEQGAWGLALAAGLAFAAWRPSRATAMFPVMSVFVVVMAVVTFTDIQAGRVAPSAEVPHLIAAFGLGLIWLDAHPPAGLWRHPV